ncbi:hypothetical protein IAI58_11580 [Roseomonas marmotae]|uniref:E2/UBC family protein n=1 Tax=Roseomonas marmotae TaxID=2768161 RepID=UPI001AD7B5E4|nr:E2/UBC family protein [Roseomonas marmotae]QTI78332.1 hypothetical protein IAI58_11580 [Roseomonas marmotae]
MSGIIAMQLEQLQERFGGVHVQHLPSSTSLVSVPDVRLPEGWSTLSTNIRFLIPPGYPYAPVDCFWADTGLRLSNGGLPQNTQEMQIPETTESGLWFSWHLTGPWDANRDTLSTWMNVVAERLRRPQ